MARLDNNSQQITKFINRSVRRGLLITDVVEGTFTNCDCYFIDDIDVTITNIWTTTPLLSTTAEQVEPDARITHS